MEEDAGKYTCMIQWGNIYIRSTEAELSVQYISVPPTTTNVVIGNSAMYTCSATTETTATGDDTTTPTITLHDADDDSKVGVVVDINDADGKTVSATITINNVAETNTGFYYCKATWSGTSVVSENVYLYVFNVKTLVETTVWGVKGNMARFMCQTDAVLQTGKGKSDMVDDATVAWTYKITEGDWTTTAQDAR